MIRPFICLPALAGVLLAGCSSLAGAPSTSAGLRVYKDPVTGEFTEPPSAIPPSAATTRPLNHTHDGLVATPSAVSGGGVRLDLQGRFRSHFVATKDADGRVIIRCVPELELPKP